MACITGKLSVNPEHPTDTAKLEDLVKDYLTRKFEWERYPHIPASTTQEWHDVYLSSLEDITEFICGAKNDNKVPDGPPYRFDSHQWPIRCTSRQHLVNDMAAALKDIGYSEYEDFEDLMQEVEKIKVSYFGDTAKYDFALRYGWKKGIRPEKYVYVHSKPRRAAQHLVDHGYLKEIKELERKMELGKYKELLLPGMTAHDIEHFLCAYHDEIFKLK